MIDIDRLLEGIVNTDAVEDVDKYEATLRLLYSTVRKYNRTYEELERLKELIGFNKSFPIFRLPREIRDRIYTYSLRAETKPRSMTYLPMLLSTEDNPFKPPTPGLLLANRRIYQEAIEILYSKNVFSFEDPRWLSDFEEQIGCENCKRVREICVRTILPMGYEKIPDPKYWRGSKYSRVPCRWIAALTASSLKIVHLGIETQSDPLRLFSMPKDLQQFVEEFLGRVAEDKVPRLTLTGFREEEKEKFPKRWKVVMDQRRYSEEEVEASQRFEDEYGTFGKL